MAHASTVSIRKNVVLEKYTTFRIGGPADFFITLETPDQIPAALEQVRLEGTPVFFLGGGSNLLVSDTGFRGTVLHCAMEGIERVGTELRCSGGTVLQDVVTMAAQSGLRGVERLAGIPGTVGGAIRGNAGAFGTEIKDVTRSVTVINRETGESKTFAPAECGFQYRHSMFKTAPEWIIIEASLHLTPGDPNVLRAEAAATIAQRQRRQIQDIKSAGSCFVNPTVTDASVRELFERDKGVQARERRVPAGWLIERAGLKGKRIGDAQTSTMHPNYLINVGRATARDVLRLIGEIKRTVKREFGVQLGEEIQYVGLTEQEQTLIS